MSKPAAHISMILLTAGLSIYLISSFGQEGNNLAQKSASHDFSISWIGQYPKEKIYEAPSGDNQKKRGKGWFAELVFGKKTDEIIKPMSVVALNKDNFWIADQGSGSILKVNNQLGTISKSKDKQLDHMPSIVASCFGPEACILFTDSQLNNIFRLNPDQGDIQILGDSLILDRPTGIAYSEQTREIWVVETKSHQIAVLNDKGEEIRRFGGRGNEPGKFNFPTYIWIDHKGVVFVVDAMNFRVQIFDEQGNFISSFGQIGDSSGYFSRPKGIATDSFGHIYIADALFHVVQVFDMNGKYLYAFGSKGKNRAQFWMPTGIFIDHEDCIYIADSYNARVQIFELDY